MSKRAPKPTKASLRAKAQKKQKKQSKAYQEPSISVHGEDAIGHDHRSIEDMDEDSFAKAIANPVRIVNDPVPDEEEAADEADLEDIKPVKVKARRLSKKTEDALTALEEEYQFDREAFTALYEKDFALGKELFTRILSLYVGMRSSVDSLHADLQLHPDLKGIDIQKSQLEPVLRYKSQELICQSLGIDPAAYFDFTVRTLEARTRAASRNNNGIPVG